MSIDQFPLKCHFLIEVHTRLKVISQQCAVSKNTSLVQYFICVTFYPGGVVNFENLGWAVLPITLTTTYDDQFT